MVVDHYQPFKIIDSVLTSNNSPSLFTLFYPHWNNSLNGWSSMDQWIKTVKPKQFYFWYYPTWYSNTPAPYVNMDEMYDYLRNRLQEAYDATAGLEYNHEFWYSAPVIGYKTSANDSVYRQLAGTEFRAATMLALGHGAKGLFMMEYYSDTVGRPGEPGYYLRTQGLVNIDGTPTSLYTFIKNNISPRINGILGKTLLNLNYTADYINKLKGTFENFQNPHNYLTFTDVGQFQSFHVGFLTGKDNDPNCKYFFLTNKIVGDETEPHPLEQYHIALNSNFPHNNFSIFKNWDITNVETNESTNFTSLHSAHINPELDYGDGALFRIAPSIKYGGSITANETVQTGTTLKENVLKIKSGATLTVAGVYNIYKDIIVEEGGTLNVESGANLNFQDGSKLIVEGFLTSPTNGIATFDFISPSNGNGIYLKRDAFDIKNIRIKHASVGIDFNLENLRYPAPTKRIRNAFFESCETGIISTNSSSWLIQNSDFLNCYTGISFSSVNSFDLVNNVIRKISPAQGETPIHTGVSLNSSTGNIRSNDIYNLDYGIICANSSPVIGDNYIYGNYYHGLYSGAGSQPDLRNYVVYCEGNQYNYAYSGHNKIYNNGNSPTDDPSEIFLNGSILLDYGQNCIYDNRDELSPPYSVQNLMNGNNHYDPIDASGNDWGYNPKYETETRFGELYVIINDISFCDYPNPYGCPIIFTTYDGIVIDTLYPAEASSEDLIEMDELYLEANNKYMANDLQGAKTIYSHIAEVYPDNKRSVNAYAKLLAIEKISGDSLSFEALRNFYLTNLNLVSDSLMQKMITQLGNLCLVNGGRVAEGIASFQQIIDNNPGSEEADFAEIDKLTASLLLPQGTLGKGLVKLSSDKYVQSVNSILNKRFGKTIKVGKESLLPDAYHLYQNYPNPFNPSTTIQYDVPGTSIVNITIYDILGREVATLVNEVKEQGRYTAQFNASSLSSGMYIYRITAGKFVSAKKMMLVK